MTRSIARALLRRAATRQATPIRVSIPRPSFATAAHQQQQSRFRYASTSSKPLSPTDPADLRADELMESAARALESGDVEGAQKMYEESLGIKEDSTALFNLGVCQYHLRDTTGAIASWEKSLVLAPSADAYTNLASAYIMSKPSNPALAIKHLTSALEMSPDDPEIAFNLAAILEMTNNLEEALELYKRAETGGVSRASQNIRSISAKILSQRSESSSSTSQRGFIPPSLSPILFILFAGAFVAYYYDSRSLLHEKVIMPLVRLRDPETGHKIAIRILGNRWLRPKDRGVDGDELSAEIFGMPVNNPVGMAAGFDKDGEAIDGLFDLGFGYVEIGSVTPEPQPGNPKPRFFRLPEDEAAINRYGFNSLGHAQMLSQLRSRLISFSKSHPSLFPSPLPSVPLPPSSIPRSLRPGHILAVNLGKNKTSPAESNEDYLRGVKMLGPYADIIVINVSSPNTPGLRALQGREILEKLLTEVVSEREKIKVDGLPKIAVKVACDLTEDELGDVAYAVRRSGVEGVIVSNTTIKRKELGLRSAEASQTGGLSGRPLFPLALKALQTLRPLLPPSIPIIGCGGISSSSDAISFARSGASLIQIYTLFGYRGVGTPRLLKDEISQNLLSRGSNWKAQIGADYSDNKTMGWDESRLEKENEKLKNEMESLGEMLRRKMFEDDMSRLVSEAEVALNGQKVSSKGEEDGGARDNLAGSTGTSTPNMDNGKMLKEKADEVGEGVVNQVQRAIEGILEGGRDESYNTRLAIEDANTEENAQMGLVAFEPMGSSLGPVVVHEVDVLGNQTIGQRGDDDRWNDEVRSGQRRLV